MTIALNAGTSNIYTVSISVSSMYTDSSGSVKADSCEVNKY